MKELEIVILAAGKGSRMKTKTPKLLNRINGKFSYLLITEHFPKKEIFTPNKDIITGPNIRLSDESAVDLLKN